VWAATATRSPALAITTTTGATPRCLTSCITGTGRAAGPYSVITSYITAEKRYGYAALPVFMLARDGELIADDGGKVSFQELGRHTDTATGKPVGNLTRYIYTDGEERYVVSSPGTPTLPRTSSSTPSRPRKLAARLAGFDGAYLRFAGELRIEHYKGDHLVDSHTDDALWELMYFGKAGPFRSGC
jgi:hypothetical protein